MMIKPIKVPQSFKGNSIVFDDDGKQRPLSEIVNIARKNGYKETPAPIDPYDSCIPYGTTPSSATRREIQDYRRTMDSLKYPENFDLEA